MKAKHIDDLWSHIHWLDVLLTAGSYTAAAARLGVSKAAVSYRINELEEAVGIPLVRRTTRAVRITEEGRRLVESTREAFDAIAKNFAAVRDSAGLPTGVVRMTAPVALGRQQIAPRLPGFMKKFPDVRVELDLSDRLTSMTQEGFDIAVRHAESVPDTHVAWTLCSTEAVLVASKSYLKRVGEPDKPQALADHNCLHYLRSGESPAWSFVPRRGQPDRVSVPVRGTFAANNSEVLREMALSGAGVALLPDFSANQELERGRLVRLLPNWRSVGSFGGQVYAMRPYSAQVPLSVRALVEYLRESMASGFLAQSQ